MSSLLSVTAGILSYNRCDDLRRTLTAVLAIPCVHVLLIDNASTDETRAMLGAEFGIDTHPTTLLTGCAPRASDAPSPLPLRPSILYPRLTCLLLEHNTGIAARNIMFDRVRTPYLLTLDDDSWPRGTDDVLRLLQTMESDRRIASVCAACVHPDTGVAETAGIERFASAGDAAHGYDVVNIAAGGSLLRMSAVRCTEGYGEEFFWGREENDLAFQLLLCGYRIVYDPRAVIWHALSPVGRRQYERLRYVTRNSLWLLWKYFPLVVALPVSLLFSLRRLLAVVKDWRRVLPVLRGIVAGYGGIAARRRRGAKLPGRPARIPLRESLQLRGWFLKLLYE